MKHTTTPGRRIAVLAAACLSAIGLAGTAGASLLPAAAATTSQRAESVSFRLIPAAGIAACLPHASGRVTITPGSQNDTMKVTVHGMPPRAGFDLFVIQEPAKPFGVAWYQTDVNTGSDGSGSATVRGILDVQTFSVSLGGTTTFAPTHQYHLGLWFNSPKVPFSLGCEPGATAPVVTPFNGRQHAGIQVLNTAQFPVNAGPLSQLHR